MNTPPELMLPQWLLWAMLAVLCWGLWAITSKLIGNALSAGQSQALSTIGLVPIIAILAFTKSKTSESNRRRGIIIGFLSGVLVCLGNIAYYHALNLGGKAATVVSITALYPLITALLAMLLLKERLNEFQIFGIGLSIASMVIFNIYSTEGWASGWLVYAMIPVVLWGVGGLLQKISTNHISGELSTLWFLVAFVPVAFVLLIAEPLKQPIEMRVWMLASALGFFFGLGNLAILLAFAREGKASVIAPLAGLYPVVSIPIAILFLGEKVSGREWLGIGLALTAVVALAWEGKKIEKAAVVPL